MENKEPTLTVISNQPIFKKRGFHNWRNLFRKPNGYEWIILFMITLGIGMAYVYKAETQICRDTLANLDQTACTICSIQQTITKENSLIKEAQANYYKEISNITIQPSTSLGGSNETIP